MFYLIWLFIIIIICGWVKCATKGNDLETYLSHYENEKEETDAKIIT